jgi:hypothetical protein
VIPEGKGHKHKTIHPAQKYRIQLLQHVNSNHPKDIERVTALSKNVVLYVALLASCFMLVSFLAYLTLEMEDTCYCKMSVDFQWGTCHYIPELRNIYMICVTMENISRHTQLTEEQSAVNNFISDNVVSFHTQLLLSEHNTTDI